MSTKSGSYDAQDGLDIIYKYADMLFLDYTCDCSTSEIYEKEYTSDGSFTINPNSSISMTTKASNVTNN
jgi:hypothetical protein